MTSHITLSSDTLKALAEFLVASAEDEGELTLQICHGHSGYGLYAWHPEYPEEGSMMFAELGNEPPPPSIEQVAVQEVVRETLDPSVPRSRFSKYGSSTTVNGKVSAELDIMGLERLLKDEEMIQEGLTLDASLVVDLGFDSLDLIELVMLIEDEFGIYIHDEDAEKLATVKDVLHFVNNTVHEGC